jgi:hypothetical protein
MHKEYGRVQAAIFAVLKTATNDVDEKLEMKS